MVQTAVIRNKEAQIWVNELIITLKGNTLSKNWL